MDKNKRSWQCAKTRAFIMAYMARKSEFENAKKKKVAMSNVLEDLIAQNVLTQPTTVKLLNTKMKNLLRAYKGAKDNNKETGNALTKAPFEDLMDEIYGNNTIISNNHTLSLAGTEIMALAPTTKPTTAVVQILSEISNSSCLEITELTQTQPTVVSPRAYSREDCGNQKQSGGRSVRHKRKTIKEKYYEEKNKIKKNYLDKKLDEMKQRRLDKAKQHEEKMEALNSFVFMC